MLKISYTNPMNLEKTSDKILAIGNSSNSEASEFYKAANNDAKRIVFKLAYIL